MIIGRKRFGSPSRVVCGQCLPALVCQFALLWFALFGLAGASYGDCAITLRWDDDPPYFIAEGDRVIGIDADIVREAMRRMECRLSLAKLPWARALMELERGRVDMLSGAYRTSERERYAHYASTVGLISPNVLFVRDSKIDWREFAGLRDILVAGFVLGAQVKVSYSEEFDDLARDPRFRKKLQYAPRRELLWAMLARNRVDAVIADRLTGLYEIRGLGLEEQIFPTDMVVSDEPAFFIFSKATVDQAFVERFDSVLQAMLNDGAFEAIVQRYTGVPEREAESIVLHCKKSRQADAEKRRLKDPGMVGPAGLEPATKGL